MWSGLMNNKTDALALPDAFRALAVEVKDALTSNDPVKLAGAHRFLGDLGSKVDKMSDWVKTALKKHIQTSGVDVGEKGSKELEVDGYKYPLRSMVPAGTLDDKKVEARLRAKGHDPTEWMDAEVRLKVNREKLEKLNRTYTTPGAFTEQDFKDCEVERKWALYPPEKVSKDE